MYNSINHPWAIGDKQRARYGNVWADMDFVFHDQIKRDIFKEDPMNTSMGHLELFKQRIMLRYKDLIFLSKQLQEQYNEAKILRQPKDYPISITIKNNQYSLTQHELSKLIDTLNEAEVTSMRAYSLGLYL
jgi:hypothetical protein